LVIELIGLDIERRPLPKQKIPILKLLVGNKLGGYWSKSKEEFSFSLQRGEKGLDLRQKNSTDFNLVYVNRIYKILLSFFFFSLLSRVVFE
jgi:hypothetical protein